ncbi:hypothetical protein EHQ55_04280 [Leptospira meyeri]|uniref:hypothetical protein n=1 Tax=Leptospira meyeri TaxID=29508 RepID=UPI00028D9FDE|nr:hypothetical protein [Leptospira meyeri]EKJ87502.1 hypothetical protein LEP1GSC017_0659 [Leptospira meyeri serovar Hardjo str. Went 5]TGL52169.1 hypothetical protein EHQ55_04280 [Leptospira meyeri]
MLARIFFILIVSVLVFGKSQAWTSIAEFTESGEVFISENNSEEPPSEEEGFLYIPTLPVSVSVFQFYSFSFAALLTYNIVSIKFPDRRGSPKFT